jgi:hypothetical protein
MFFKAHTDPKYFSILTMRSAVRFWGDSTTKRSPFNTDVNRTGVAVTRGKKGTNYSYWAKVS